MAKHTTPPRSEPGKGKKVLYTAIILSFLGVLTILVTEMVLRVLPIPGLSYHLFRYDELTGGGLYPNTTMVYRNARGDHVRRNVNSMGFLDREHDLAKAPDVVRIGFFGDSYTEARQVGLDETFFRRIEGYLNKESSANRYECIAAGLSGYSTLQSYLECTRWMETLDLDWVVYVFVENDPGDQIAEIKRSSDMPTAYLSGDTVAIDFSFRDRNRHKQSKSHRMFQYVKARSILLSTVTSRLKLLRKQGIKMRVTEQDMHMEAGDAGNTVPTVTTPPSAWPDSLIEYTGRVGEGILERWVADVRAAGPSFAVIYIPREKQMAKPYAEQDSWVVWLDAICKRNAVDLIDPSDEFVRALDRGEEVYYDHLTAAGHGALARVFSAYFLEKVGEK